MIIKILLLFILLILLAVIATIINAKRFGKEYRVPCTYCIFCDSLLDDPEYVCPFCGSEL